MKQNITREIFLKKVNDVGKGKFPIFYKPYSLKSLLYYAHPRSESFYREFEIFKKNGNKRVIHAPKWRLKYLQQIIKEILEEQFVENAHIHGFVKNRSIFTNAINHVDRNYVFNIDLEDFFPSVTEARVIACLKIPPFNLNSHELTIAKIIAGICTYNLDPNDKVRVLPQGAPTSPLITNIVCQRLDRKLNGLAKRFNLRFTRYADDITFSSDHNVYQDKSEFRMELQRIITDQGFKIHNKKTRLQTSDHRQIVTGLVVNKKLNIPRYKVKRLRMYLYYWEKYGEFRANLIFKSDFLKDKYYYGIDPPNLRSYLEGYFSFLKVMHKNDDSYLDKLEHRFKELKKYIVIREHDIDKTIEIILDEGLEQGIDNYIRLKKLHIC